MRSVCHLAALEAFMLLSAPPSYGQAVAAADAKASMRSRLPITKQLTNTTMENHQVASAITSKTAYVTAEDKSIRPFKINVPEADLKDL